MNRQQLGILGEKIASEYLKRKGYQILDKNYSFRIPGNPQKGEIDIVARKSDLLSFIEVKTLIEDGGGRTSAISPEDKVNYLKQRKIIRMAESWLMKKKKPLDSKWQIDVISIKMDLNSKKAKIRHLKNVVA